MGEAVRPVCIVSILFLKKNGKALHLLALKEFKMLAQGHKVRGVYLLERREPWRWKEVGDGVGLATV